MATATYPEFSDWLDFDEWDDDDLYRVFFRFQYAISEQDEGRDIEGLLNLYRDNPALRPMLDDVMVWLTGWTLPTIVTGKSSDGQIPDGFEKIDYM